MFNLSTPVSPFLSLYPSLRFLLATSLQCADGEFRDMSPALVPGCSGQLLPPGEEKKKNLLADSLNLAISLAVQSFF